jgi:hypothetical protein
MYKATSDIPGGVETPPRNSEVYRLQIPVLSALCRLNIFNPPPPPPQKKILGMPLKGTGRKYVVCVVSDTVLIYMLQD